MHFGNCFRLDVTSCNMYEKTMKMNSNINRAKRIIIILHITIEKHYFIDRFLRHFRIRHGIKVYDTEASTVSWKF